MTSELEDLTLKEYLDLLVDSLDGIAAVTVSVTTTTAVITTSLGLHP